MRQEFAVGKSERSACRWKFPEQQRLEISSTGMKAEECRPGLYQEPRVWKDQYFWQRMFTRLWPSSQNGFSMPHHQAGIWVKYAIFLIKNKWCFSFEGMNKQSLSSAVPLPLHSELCQVTGAISGRGEKQQTRASWDWSAPLVIKTLGLGFLTHKKILVRCKERYDRWWLSALQQFYGLVPGNLRDNVAMKASELSSHTFVTSLGWNHQWLQLTYLEEGWGEGYQGPRAHLRREKLPTPQCPAFVHLILPQEPLRNVAEVFEHFPPLPQQGPAHGRSLMDNLLAKSH